ncbi:hypothetical protein MYU51_004171 [Penicillium brevicompactum]
MMSYASIVSKDLQTPDEPGPALEVIVYESFNHNVGSSIDKRRARDELSARLPSRLDPQWIITTAVQPTGICGEQQHRPNGKYL